MSRAKAKKMFTIDDHVQATRDVECRKDADVIDETPMAYKDVDDVMAAQSDLVDVVHTLKQVVCVKGWWTLWWAVGHFARLHCTWLAAVASCVMLRRLSRNVSVWKECTKKVWKGAGLSLYFTRHVILVVCQRLNAGLRKFRAKVTSIW